MAASIDLFELIKSLSKSEKRYFRLTASLNAKNRTSKYVQLFDMIDAQSEHDEQAVRAMFATRFDGRHYSEAKYYLYNAILRALHAYAADRSIDVQIVTALHQAELLFSRRLFRQSARIAARAHAQAVAHDLWHLAAAAARMEYHLAARQGLKPKEVDDLTAKVLRHGDAWRSTLQHWSVYVRMVTRTHAIGRPRSATQLAMFNEPLQALEAPDETSRGAGGTCAMPSSAIYRLFSIAVARDAARDTAGAIAAYRAMLPIVRSSRLWNRAGHLALTPVLFNICLLSIKARDIDCFHAHYPLLMQQTVRSPESEQYDTHVQALALLPDLLMSMGDCDGALAAAKPMLQAAALASGGLSLERRSYISLLMVAIHFGRGDHAGCLEWLQTVFAMQSEGLPAFKYGLARVFQLIVHFERGDDDLLEYLLRSTHRYFVANRFGFKAEGVIIDFIKRALRSRTVQERHALFGKLLEAIAPLCDDPFERDFLHSIDLVAWLESKVTGRPYAAVLRDQFIAEQEQAKRTLHAGDRVATAPADAGA